MSWVRAPGAEACASAGAIAEAIEQRLGRPALVRPAWAELFVEAHVTPLESGFRVTIALSRESGVVGRRELASADSSCRELAESAALAIALMIDPEAALEPKSETAEPESTPKSEALPEAVASQPPQAPRTQSEPEGTAEAAPWQGDLEVAAGITAGLMPRLAPGVHLRGRALPPDLPVALELESAYFPERSVESEPGKGADFALFYAGAATCTVPPRSTRIAASACAGFQVGSITGRGYGFDHSPKFQTWLVTLAVRGRLWFRPTRGLALLIGPEVSVPLKRDHFETSDAEGSSALFRLSPVAGGFELGVVWEL